MTAFRLTPLTLVRVRNRVREGECPRKIAATLGCDEATLRRVCLRHGISLVPDHDLVAALDAPPRPKVAKTDRRLDPDRRHGGGRTFRTFPVRVAGLACSRLEHEAALRGTTTDVLAAVCLEFLAADNLFAAVLDR